MVIIWIAKVALLISLNKIYMGVGNNGSSMYTFYVYSYTYWIKMKKLIKETLIIHVYIQHKQGNQTMEEQDVHKTNMISNVYEYVHAVPSPY